MKQSKHYNLKLSIKINKNICMLISYTWYVMYFFLNQIYTMEEDPEKTRCHIFNIFKFCEIGMEFLNI